MKKLTLICCVCLMLTFSIKAQKAINPPAGGKAISNELIGIFFEDISSAASSARLNAMDGERVRHGELLDQVTLLVLFSHWA